MFPEEVRRIFVKNMPVLIATEGMTSVSSRRGYSDYCCRRKKTSKSLHSHPAKTAVILNARTSVQTLHFVASILTTGPYVIPDNPIVLVSPIGNPKISTEFKTIFSLLVLKNKSRKDSSENVDFWGNDLCTHFKSHEYTF